MVVFHLNPLRPPTPPGQFKLHRENRSLSDEELDHRGKARKKIPLVESDNFLYVFLSHDFFSISS